MTVPRLRETSASSAHNPGVEILTLNALEAGLDAIRRAPADAGRLELIVRRPAVNERELLGEATLDPEQGLVGDRWRPGRSGARDTQLTLINVRVATLVAGGEAGRELAGDQLYVDLDLTEANLPARLEVGSAVIELSAIPHLGCEKFSARFGDDARAFVNSPVGRELRLRGVNACVVTAGMVRVGDAIRRLT